MFDFITKEDLTAEKEDEMIEEMKNEALEGEDTEDEIRHFLLYHIPRSLGIYSTMEEINSKLSDIKNNLDTLVFGRHFGVDERKWKELEDDSTEEGKEQEEEKIDKKLLPPKKSKKFDPFEGMTKAERKKLVKEQNKEKRKNKIPKKKKKQMMKKAQNRKKR